MVGLKKLATLLLILNTLLTPIKAMAGTASATYYHNGFQGRRMANGKVFRQNSNSVASNGYKLGTKLRICHKSRCVIGVVRDRCGNCSLDLSKGLFKQLAPLKRGRIKVRVRKL